MKTVQHQPKLATVPEQRRGFVMCNSDNMAEGSNSTAQDIFSRPRGGSQKCGHILGFVRVPRGN